MRQGPDYRMWIEPPDDKHDQCFLRIPLELTEDFIAHTTVIWHDNNDGTYVLRLIKDGR